MFLGATISNAEAGHDFVKDQQSTVLGGEFSQAFKEFFGGWDEARVSDDGFQDNGRHLVFLQELLNGFQVVVLCTQCAGGCTLGNPRRVRQSKCGDTRAGLYQKSVAMAMVATLELDDHIPFGEGSDKAEHSHAGLRAAVGEAHHLYRRHSIDHHLSQLVLKSTGCAEGGALLHLLVQRLQDGVICVSDDGRAPSSNIVNVLITVNIPCIGTFHTVEDNWVASN
mmetsp:Transcript_148944/g.211574  ORF Transcript_148944/g.211574 Transcript_148944/m.211574 type:complete len:224 (-) Transcript_148944:413-1084(-)